MNIQGSHNWDTKLNIKQMFLSDCFEWKSQTLTKSLNQIRSIVNESRNLFVPKQTEINKHSMTYQTLSDKDLLCKIQLEKFFL